MSLRRILAAAGLAAAAAVAPSGAAGGSPRASHRLPLVTVAELGSLSWTCDARGGAQAIRLRTDRVDATERVRMRVGSALRTFTLQPGESASVRAGGARAVRIEISQATEARNLRASISLTFAGPGIRSYCYPYFPPAVALSLHY